MCIMPASLYRGRRSSEGTMKQLRNQSLKLQVFFFLSVISAFCLALGSQQSSAAAQTGESPIEIFWSADETGRARPTANEVSIAAGLMPAIVPQTTHELLPRAAYSDSTNDLLYKWLRPDVSDVGLSVGGGVMTTDLPAQALGLPSSFYWRTVTFDRNTYNLVAFDYVPNSSSTYFNGTSTTLSDSTNSSIPPYADLTKVNINNNGATTRWVLTSRGVHPGLPESYRLGYNNLIEIGNTEVVQFIGATPFSASGWWWSLRDRRSHFPWWSDDLDIISVGVESINNQQIRFSTRVDGYLGNSYSSTAAWPRFEWYIDADNDTSTGDTFTFSYQEGTYVFRYDLVGVEAIATAFYDPDSGRWVGMLRKKVSPSEWQMLDVATPTVSGDAVAIDFSRVAAGVRSTFRWGLVSSFDVRRGNMGYSGRVDVAPNSGMKTEALVVDPDQLLAERFAPNLYLANTDELFPVTIYYTLSESRLLNQSGGLIKDKPSVDDLYTHRSDFSKLDMFGDTPSEAIGRWQSSQGSIRSPVIYAGVFRSGNRTVIQYWFNYFYNGWGYTKGCNLPGLCIILDGLRFGNNHEGDWEMIQVVLQDGIPKYAAYSQHGHPVKRLWEHVEKGGQQGENPNVYVAYGSHASYFKDSFYVAGSAVLQDHAAEKTGLVAAPAMGIELLPTDTSAIEPKWLPFSGLWGNDSFVGGSPHGPRWKTDNVVRDVWDNPFKWGDEAKWDDDQHYGYSFGLFSQAYKVSISGDFSRHTDLQLKTGYFGSVIIDKDHNALDSSGKKAEFLLNCEADARQTILIHKVTKPANSVIFFKLNLSEVNCPSGMRSLDEGATIPLSIELNIPQANEGQVTIAQFKDVNISTEGGAFIDLSSPSLLLSIDHDGDGTVDEAVAPSSINSEHADTTPPAKITDLVFENSGGGRLRWTSTADDGLTGRSAAYQIRYAKFPITDETWDYSQPIVHGLTPGVPGTVETLNLTDLPPGSYFFAVRAIDMEYNASPISNGATGTITGLGGSPILFVPITAK